MSRNAIANLVSGFSMPGRTLLRRYAPFAALIGRAPRQMPDAERMLSLADALLSGRGEASGVALASDLLALYAEADETQKAAFFAALATRFNPDEAALARAWECYRLNGLGSLPELTRAVEAPRVELFRRLNLAPGGTAARRRWWPSAPTCCDSRRNPVRRWQRSMRISCTCSQHGSTAAS